VEWPDGGRYIVQAANDGLAVGWAVDVGLVDEAWDVGVIPVTQGLKPAMSDRPNPLLVLVSTAAVGASDLLSLYRTAALEHGEVALFEWSAAEGSDHRDEETWRSASPVWDERRVRFLRRQVGIDSQRVFQSQYLCQPVDAERSTAGEALVDAAAWAACEAPLAIPEVVDVAAVEDNFGRGGALALAWREEETVCVRVTVAPLADCWALASRAQRVVCGKSLDRTPPATAVAAQGLGWADTASAMSAMRGLVGENTLRWSGDALVGRGDVRVARGAGNMLIVLRGQDMTALKVCLWAAAQVTYDTSTTPAVY
jgi:hypothetical protein